MLSEECNKLKTDKDHLNFENRRLLDENEKLRSNQGKEHEKCLQLTDETFALSNQNKEMRLNLEDLDRKLKFQQKLIEDMKNTHEDELKRAAENTRSEILRTVEEEKRDADQKRAIHKLEIENEFHKINQQLRQSYSFSGSPNEFLVQTGGNMEGGMNESALISSSLTLNATNVSFHDLSDELKFRKMILSLNEEKNRLIQQINTKNQQIRNDIEKEYSSKLEIMEKALFAEYSQNVSELKNMLSQASLHIEKLKSMVKEGKTVIAFQNDRIEQLKSQVLQSSQLNTSSHNVANQANSGTQPLTAASKSLSPRSAELVASLR
jgi:hypothetical protein